MMSAEYISKKLIDINKRIKYMESKQYGTDSSYEYIERLKRFRRLYLQELAEAYEREGLSDRLI